MTKRQNGQDQARETQEEYRKLPAVDALLRRPVVELLGAEYGIATLTDAIRTLLEQARQEIRAGGRAPDETAWLQRIDAHLRTQHAPSLRPVINATGVIVHTNLGRAPLSRDARTAVDAVVTGYSNLEYELESGSRGSRHDHARARLCALTGAEDAMVVNNNAAAVYLTLAALCAGREVLISRGELVEIGGGFRIPDVLRAGGCRLVEVGTTNRTHPRDFADAITAQTAALMRVHSSNFRQIGFVTQPTLAELAAIAKAAHREGPPVMMIDDLGSGSLLSTADYGLAPEPMVQESVAAGADIITFSGDKLLGGPQAGLIVGKAELIAAMRRHPMARALRVDKMTLAALDATLAAYQRGRAHDEIPVWQMISATLPALTMRVQRWQETLAATCADAATGITVSRQAGESAVGGGSLPGETLPTQLLSVTFPQPDVAAQRLRHMDPPVVCRIRNDTLLFDSRTVRPEQDDTLLGAIAEVINHG